MKDLERNSKAGLRPVFEAGGSVTAGNSSQMSDGAAFYLNE
jgi:acetyl-CoA acyltransferase